VSSGGMLGISPDRLLNILLISNMVFLWILVVLEVVANCVIIPILWQVSDSERSVVLFLFLWDDLIGELFL
jgi:hypothetical protein